MRKLNQPRWMLPLLCFWLVLIPALVRAEPQAAPAKTQRFFWKITSPTTEVCFLGSIHIAKPEMYPLPDEIEAAFKKSDTVVVEADISKVDQMAFAAKLMAIGMYADGDSLAKHISPASMKVVQDYCEKNGLPVELVSTMKPPLAALMIQGLMIQKMGLDPESGIDMHYLKLANAGTPKKKVGELESIDTQTNLLLGMEDKLAEKWLVDSLKDNSPAELDKLMKSWNAGDEKAILEQMAGEEKADPDVAKVMNMLIYKRNDDMTKKIDEMLKGKDKVFVIVGAAHFLGEKGILKQLEAKGYKVERPELSAPKSQQNP